MIGVMAAAANMPAGRLDPGADFDAWMRAEQGRIFLLCCRLLADRGEAEGAVQEVFLKSYRNLVQGGANRLEDPARWLTRVAVNACLDRLRSRRWRFWRDRPEPADEQIILALAPEPGPDAEDRLFASEIAARLAKALVRLSERQRAVFVLRHYEDRSLEEIAAVLSLDVGTVKAHLSRAVAKLRRELRDLYLRPARRAG